MSEAEIRPHPFPLAGGRVWALGGSIELDGRISWVPAEARGSLPVSCYLLGEGDRHVLVDSGIALHEEAVLAQLAGLVPPGSPLSVFLTRAEFDAFGNVGPIAEAYRVDSLYTGGVSNPFDAFDFVGLAGRGPGAKIEIARQPPGFGIDLGPGRRLEVLAPALRILATYWVFDTATGILFTSDAFGHHRPEQPADLHGAVREHLLAKFGWLRGADVEKIVASLDGIFGGRSIEVIAPGHGHPIVGSAEVQRHYRAMRSAIASLGRHPAPR